MRIIVITPSFNQLDFLKRCVASVRDQIPADMGSGIHNIEVHHHVQDACSADGTQAFLEECARHERTTMRYKLTFTSEADKGMYDALNKAVEQCNLGWAAGACLSKKERRESPSPASQSSGDKDTLVAWLNCDEQYLPGTLEKVGAWFAEHPDENLLCGDALVVDPAGELTGFWKAMPLRLRYVQSSYLYNLSCAMFFRAETFLRGCPFDASYKAVGDQEFIIRLLRKGVRTGRVGAYLAAYTFFPDNMSEQRFAKVEQEILRRRWTGVLKRFRWVWRTCQSVERVLRGCRKQRFPVEYNLFIDGYSDRKTFRCGRVPASWPGVRNSG